MYINVQYVKAYCTFVTVSCSNKEDVDCVIDRATIQFYSSAIEVLFTHKHCALAVCLGISLVS